MHCQIIGLLVWPTRNNWGVLQFYNLCFNDSPAFELLDLNKMGQCWKKEVFFLSLPLPFFMEVFWKGELGHRPWLWKFCASASLPLSLGLEVGDLGPSLMTKSEFGFVLLTSMYCAPYIPSVLGEKIGEQAYFGLKILWVSDLCL